MLFYVFTALFAVIYYALLDLGKNSIIGWLIAGLILIIYLLSHLFLKKVSKKGFGYSILCFVILVLLLAINFKLTGPKPKLVPAVANKNPKVTDIVSINQGQLTGVYNADESVKVYAGIPFAAAPVGDLRFKEPKDPSGWDGVHAFDTFAPEAWQAPASSPIYDSLSHILGYHDYQWLNFSDNYLPMMSEDCLYLNVFAPADAKPDDNLPVLVYIHGGSLQTGYTWFEDYRGEDLAKQNIIVVSIAYRLNIFGYLALPDLADESPNGTTGNYGLLDQIQGLKWVQKNISAFGGDPFRVTICGESAGSSSVNALCVSPLAKGLFNQAIGESSSVLAKVPYHTFRTYEDAIETGESIKSELGIKSLDELRKLSSEELFKAGYNNSSMTVDGYAITEQPYLTYEKGENNEKALLNGFNGHEADVFLMTTNATKDNYIELIEPIFGKYSRDAADLVPADSVEQYSPFIIDEKGEAKGALNKLYSAAWFTYSHYLWTNYMLKENRPVYEYIFTKDNKVLGDFHSGELPYVFGNLWRHPGVYDESDYALSDQMTRYWANFVKYSDPNGKGDSDLPYWPASTNVDTVFELGEHVGQIKDPYIDLYKLLDKYQEDLPPIDRSDWKTED